MTSNWGRGGGDDREEDEEVVVDSIVSGRLDRLPPAVPRSVCVFLSSTFSGKTQKNSCASSCRPSLKTSVPKIFTGPRLHSTRSGDRRSFEMRQLNFAISRPKLTALQHSQTLKTFFNVMPFIYGFQKGTVKGGKIRKEKGIEEERGERDGRTCSNSLRGGTQVCEHYFVFRVSHCM